MKHIISFIILHIIMYLIGSFVAWNFNPLQWWLFTSSYGRVFFIVLECIWIRNLIDEY